MKDFGLYIVLTQPVLDYATFTEICVREGVPMLQLREKHLPDKELLSLTFKLKAIATGSDTHFIINDRPDILSLSQADGLHLGPDDLPWQQVKPLLPPHAILGVSTHSIAEAEAVVSQNTAHLPSYMSFGPIYPTPAKAKPDAAVGTDNLHYVISKSPLPVVAIGGLFPHNLEPVLAAGARNIAMIRHFTQSQSKEELTDKIRTIQAMLKENQ